MKTRNFSPQGREYLPLNLNRSPINHQAIEQLKTLEPTPQSPEAYRVEVERLIKQNWSRENSRLVDLALWISELPIEELYRLNLGGAA